MDPIIEYKNLNAFRGEPDAYGISVTGGYVYRGSKLKGLEGTYIFADWSQNWECFLPQVPKVMAHGTCVDSHMAILSWEDISLLLVRMKKVNSTS